MEHGGAIPNGILLSAPLLCWWPQTSGYPWVQSVLLAPVVWVREGDESLSARLVVGYGTVRAEDPCNATESEVLLVLRRSRSVVLLRPNVRVVVHGLEPREHIPILRRAGLLSLTLLHQGPKFSGRILGRARTSVRPLLGCLGLTEVRRPGHL